MYTDNPDIELIEKRIAKIRSEIDQFEQTLNKITLLGGDGRDLKNEYHNLIVSTKDLSSYMDDLKKAINADADNPDARARAHTLYCQAIAQLRRLQELGRQMQTYAKQAPGSAPHQDGLTGTKFAPTSFLVFDEKPQETVMPPGQQLSAVLSQAEDEQQARDMERLESDIVQVNEMFTTLATYVHDQGAHVDSIADHCQVVYDKVNEGTVKLANSHKYRNSARRKKFICVIIVVVVLAVLALILGLSLK